MAETITENEKKKEYLNSYKNLCRKLKCLEEQQESIREAEQSAKIQELSGMPHGGKQKDLSDYIVKIDRVMSKIIKTKQECLNRKIDIESCIANMQDGMESLIIRKRYIEFKPWEQICIEIGYEWAQTHRAHARALKNLKINNMIHNDTIFSDIV